MEWRRGPVIGRGSYATVSLATTATGDLVAVKSTELSCSVFLRREQHFLSQLSSPNVIEYMGFDVDYDDNKPMYNLLMEYAPGGTISDVIKNQGGSLDESMIRSYTHHILLGLDYLHSNNLVHCDIKGQNLLVGKDGIKIGDLGCAKLACNTTTANSAFSGTPVFMAPEVARGEEQGFPADVWALGCTVIEMATGANPWPELKDPVSALYRIGYSGDVPEFPRWLSEEGKDFLGMCLKRDAEERWTAKELLQHPFVDNSNSDSEKIQEFTRKSPTSILDQGFWDALEVPEASPEPTQILNFSGDSPAERLRQLIQATPSASPCFPNWADEENWVTVRISHTDQTAKISGQNLVRDLDDDDDRESTPTESFLFPNFYVAEEEELESSVTDEDLFLLECPVFETSSESVMNVSRVVDCQNIINDNYMLIDSKLNSGRPVSYLFIPPAFPYISHTQRKKKRNVATNLC